MLEEEIEKHFVYTLELKSENAKDNISFSGNTVTENDTTFFKGTITIKQIIDNCNTMAKKKA